MNTIHLPEDDGSKPARKRKRTITGAPINYAPRTHTDLDCIPDVDWTGHQYKSPRACRVIDYNHAGRDSDATIRALRGNLTPRQWREQLSR